MTDNDIYDTIIVGSGAAGLTAGIYSSRREMKTLIIGIDIGGQIIWASQIENYPGFKNINSFDLISKIQEQVFSLGIKIIQDKVIKINKEKNKFNVFIKDRCFFSKTIILAMGLKPRELFVDGEKRLRGKGVSYCATCDGPIYKNKIVAVVGGGNSALDSAEFLSNISKKIYLIHRKDQFRAFEYLINKVKSKKNIIKIMNSNVIEIIGENRVKAIKVINNLGVSQLIKVEGLFIEIGREANTELVKDWIKLDKNGQIIVDNRCRTNHKGVFAAGDITNVPYKQIVIACGQGAIAALSAYEYLQTRK